MRALHGARALETAKERTVANMNAMRVQGLARLLHWKLSIAGLMQGQNQGTVSESNEAVCPHLHWFVQPIISTS